MPISSFRAGNRDIGHLPIPVDMERPASGARLLNERLQAGDDIRHPQYGYIPGCRLAFAHHRRLHFLHCANADLLFHAALLRARLISRLDQRVELET